MFQDPQPAPDVLAGAYYHDEGFTVALFGELRPITIANAQRKLDMLRSKQLIAPGMRTLDVGASSGAWLELAAEAGLAGTGVELGAATAAAARERGLDVRTGTLDEALPGLRDERFDLITFWDVLEHLPDPRHELGLAGSLLSPGGRVAATFPNVDGLYPRITYRLFALRTGVWEYPELPVHLYDFAPATARRVFEQGGLAVDEITTYATPFDFYRTTSLSPDRLGHGRRARALRAAFDVVHRVVYPLARLTDGGNAQLVLARAAPAGSPS